MRLMDVGVNLCNLCVALPQFDGFVVFQSSRCDNIFGWMTCRAKHSISVTLKTLNNFLAL